MRFLLRQVILTMAIPSSLGRSFRSGRTKYFCFALLAGCLFSASPSFAAVKTFNVKDFGAIGDGKNNDEPAIQAAINAAIHSKSPSNILIPGGTYVLSGNLKSIAALTVIHANDMTITGTTDTTLRALEGNQHVFLIQGSSQIHVTDMSIERENSSFTQGYIKSIGNNGKDVQIEMEQGYKPPSDILATPGARILVFPESSLTWGHHDAACAYYNAADPSVCWPPKIVSSKPLPSNIWELALDGPLESSDVGKKAAIWNAIYRGRAVRITRSSDVYISNIHYYANGGDGGFVVDRSAGNVEFDNFTVGIPQNSDQLIGSIEGGMIFNNHAHIIFQNVDISHSWDDDLNIGANFARIYNQISPTVIRVSGNRPDFKIGDELSVWNWDRKEETARVKITAIQCSTSTPIACVLTLDKSINVSHSGFAPDVSKGNENDHIDRVIDLDSQGTLTITNSSFQSLHARCLVIKAADVSISNSRCFNTIMAGILIGPSFFWDEGLQPNAITIKDSIFQDVSGPNIEIISGKLAEQPPMKVLIEGNKFIDYGQFVHGIQNSPRRPIVANSDVNLDFQHNDMVSKFVGEQKQSITSLPSGTILY